MRDERGETRGERRLRGAREHPLPRPAESCYDWGVTTVFKAHFDGKVLIPDEPVSLPANQQVRVTVQTSVDASRSTSGRDLVESLARLRLTPDESAEMDRAIAEECERINPDDWK